MTSVVAVADLHGNLPDRLPDGDLLLIAGDICPVTNHALEFQARWLEDEFYPWLDRLPHTEIAWVAGNHDFVCEDDGWQAGGRGHYLLDRRADLCGLSVYGTPWIPTLRSWAFFAEPPELVERMAAIPEVDVVVSHGPPAGYGDRLVGGRSVGTAALTSRLLERPPRLCVFGHIHEDWGSWDLEGCRLANVSWVDERYRPRPDAAMRFEI